MAFGKSRRSTQTYDNTNRGILFENDRKRSDKHPDVRGTLNVEGRDYWVSGWEKETKNGPALSLSIEPKQEARRQQYERSRDEAPRQSERRPTRAYAPEPYDERNPPPHRQELDDEIPF